MPGPDLTMEASCSGIVAGIDEAGRGPWAGPVVAAAVVLDPRQIPEGIDDSKKLSPAKRQQLFDHIVIAASCGIGIATASEIDTLNILEATCLAMRRAVENLGVVPAVALVDGHRAPGLSCKTITIIGGDAKSLSIAAASIIAKVTRDRIMQQLASEFDGYGWERNAGYGTGEHQKALVNLGVTPHHRRSFAPVRALLEATDLFAA